MSYRNPHTPNINPPKAPADLSSLDKVAKAVLEIYLRTGAPVEIDELAEHFGKSPSTIRNWINKLPGGWMRGIDSTRVEHDKRSTDYPMYTVGSVLATAYWPTRETLRAALADLRKDAESTIESYKRELAERDAPAEPSAPTVIC